MGIIIKQSIRGSIYSYLGVALGFVNVIILMPHVLLPEEIGLVNLLVAMSNIFAEFSGLGTSQVTTRLFSYFRNKQNKNNGYFLLLMSIATVGLVLTLIVFYLIQPSLVHKNGGADSLFGQYSIYLIPLIAGTLYFNVFDNLMKVLYSSTAGTLYKEVLFRILVFIDIIAVYLKLYSFHTFLIIYLIALILPAAFLLVGIIKKGAFNLSRVRGFVTHDLRNQIIKLASFGMLSSVSGMVINNIDTYLVASYLDLQATGIYSIAFFMGSLLLKPSMALSKISSVVLADSWKNNDLKNIFSIYHQGCTHMFLIGTYILLAIWINIDNIFGLLPQQYGHGQYVVLLIGMAFLADMVSGTSGMILATSVDYPKLTYFSILASGVLLGCGYWFISRFGIIGAAYAVLCSRTVFSVSKIIYMQIRYQVHPFNRAMLLITLIALAAWVSVYFIPPIPLIPVDILVRSSIFSIVFWGLTLRLKIMPTLQHILKQTLHRIRKS